MAGDDNNKNDGGSDGITYDSPYYLHPSDYPKQLHENRTSHESAAFKAFQRRNGLNKQRSKAKAVEEGNKHCTECNKDGHTRDGFFKLIGYPEWWQEKKGKKNKGKAACKATHFEAPVVIPNGDSILVKGKGDHILPGGTKVNGVLYVPDFKCNLLSIRKEDNTELKMVQVKKSHGKTQPQV
ncbi:hypothetical protein Tco_1500731 [Tanacetum coccineum]